MQKPHPREACILFGETINTSIYYSRLEGITSKKSNKEQMILSVRARDFILVAREELTVGLKNGKERAARMSEEKIPGERSSEYKD